MARNGTVGRPLDIPRSRSEALISKRCAGSIGPVLSNPAGKCGTTSISWRAIVRSAPEGSLNSGTSVLGGGVKPPFPPNEILRGVGETRVAVASDGLAAERAESASEAPRIASDPPAPIGRLKSTGLSTPTMRVTFGMTVLPKRSEAGLSRAVIGCETTAVAPSVERPFLKSGETEVQVQVQIHLVVLSGDTPDFLKRCDSLHRLVDADHAQGFHSFGNGLILDHRGGSALDD